MSADVKTSTHFDHAEFVRIWQTSQSATEAATRLSEFTGSQIGTHHILELAEEYRDVGVHLKVM